MKILFIFLFVLTFFTGCSYNISNEISDVENTSAYRLSTKVKTPIEEEISSFSTTISNKEENRQNNVSIACSALNGTIVKSGETFSFCETLGPAKPEDGYEKADTFEADGDIIQEYGGGKCQISSTLYNAVLKVPELVVVERHPHSRKVYYVEEGKDAAISYGSVDFKFTNNTGYDIKIYSSNTVDTIDVRIVKIF